MSERRGLGRIATRATVLGVSIAAALAIAGCSGTKRGGPAAPAGAGLERTTDPAALIALADSAIGAAEPELARRALARAAEVAPQSAAVHIAFGRYYTVILRYKDAKSELERAAALTPSSPEPHYWLGVAYAKASQKEDALRSFTRALRLDSGYAPAREAIRQLLEDRYRAAGIPGDYGAIQARPSITRGELGVMLAVELGADPDRTVWREDQAHRADWAVLDEAWGSRWLRASVARGWIAPLADADLHLDDPVTRGALALLVAEIQARAPISARADSAGPGAGGPRGAIQPRVEFQDLGPRHYLGRAAATAVALGLPVREGGRFEPQAFAAGYEALLALRGLARAIGAAPVVSGEPEDASLVK